MERISRLSRRIFQYVIDDLNKRRAIAFAILMKNRKPASVVKDCTDKGLSRISGLAPGTCKKYVQVLMEMGLVSMSIHKGHKYLYFDKLKAHKKKNRGKVGYHTPKHKDIDLGNYDATSVRTIEMTLKALSIVEIQRRKDYAQQCISAKQNSRDLREIKKAEKICRARGWDSSFVDNGISYNRIRRQLNCSPNTVSATIQYGEKNGLFTVTRCEPELVFHCPGHAKEAVQYLDISYSWCTDDNVYYQPANRFRLTISE